jgi:hypothetical protein
VAVSFTAAVAALVRTRGSLLGFLAIAWLALAVCLETPVWDIPSNAARTFAPLWTIAILMLAQQRRPHRTGSIPHKAG